MAAWYNGIGLSLCMAHLDSSFPVRHNPQDPIARVKVWQLVGDACSIVKLPRSILNVGRRSLLRRDNWLPSSREHIWARFVAFQPAASGPWDWCRTRSTGGGASPPRWYLLVYTTFLSLSKPWVCKSQYSGHPDIRLCSDHPDSEFVKILFCIRLVWQRNLRLYWSGADGGQPRRTGQPPLGTAAIQAGRDQPDLGSNRGTWSEGDLGQSPFGMGFSGV